MAMPPQKFREIVFQLLYAQDIGRGKEEELIQLISSELAVSKIVVREALKRAVDILSKLPEIDPLIAKASFTYEFERIRTVERNILRMGAFELLYDDEIPAKIAITEAIRLARKFATPESANFVNAILDNIYKEKLGVAIDKGQLSDAIDNLTKSEETTKNMLENE